MGDMNKYFLVSVKCEINNCHCGRLVCTCLKESIKSFYMTKDHYPTKHEIFESFSWSHEGTPISIISFSELPNESVYDDFRW